MSLQWDRPDDHHFSSACGRFTVSRLTNSPAMWYIAWRRNGDKPAYELASVQVGIEATHEQRQAALEAMQRVCEADGETQK